MFILGNFLKAVATICQYTLQIYMYVIVARAVLSWVSPDPYNPIVKFINNITDPVLDRIRRTIPTVFSGIDLSPIIAFFCIMFLQIFLVNTLYRLAIILS